MSDPRVLSDGQFYITGVACAYGDTQSYNLELYLGGSRWANGSFLRTVKADSLAVSPADTEAMTKQCGGSSNNHRFHIYLSPAERIQYKGKRIFLHFIDNRKNPLFGGSGDYVVE